MPTTRQGTDTFSAGLRSSCPRYESAKQPVVAEKVSVPFARYWRNRISPMALTEKKTYQEVVNAGSG
jgi:hypothetical protein